MIHWHESIGSTMLEAARLADAGCPHGSTVVADEQTAGQGRHGRRWHSEKGTGLYATVVLRLADIEPADLPVVTLALGLAAAATIGLGCDLRWPNDVLIEGKKCCGILTQLHVGGGGAVLAGIGINVNHADFPEDLAGIATSLKIASGRGFDRKVLLDQLLSAVETQCRALREHGRQEIIRRFTQASSYVCGRRVRIEDTGETGITDGLDGSGFLILKRDDGRRITVFAGGVRSLNDAKQF